MRASAEGLESRAASTRSASAATVGASKIARSGTSTPRLPAHEREHAWPAANGRRARRSPRSLRPAPRPGLRPDSAQRLLGRGPRCHVRLAPLRRTGAGSARRSTLPFGFRGSRSSNTNGPAPCTTAAVPTGAPADPCWRSPPPPAGPRRPPGASPPEPSSRTTTTASRTCGRPARTASTSPGSILKPRTFTCWSTRPRYSSSPLAATAQVSAAVEPPSRLAAERIRDEPLRRQLRPAQIAARHAGPAHVQLSGHRHRYRFRRSCPARTPAGRRPAGRSASLLPRPSATAWQLVNSCTRSARSR